MFSRERQQIGDDLLRTTKNRHGEVKLLKHYLGLYLSLDFSKSQYLVVFELTTRYILAIFFKNPLNYFQPKYIPLHER